MVLVQYYWSNLLQIKLATFTKSGVAGEKKVLGSWSACPDCIFMRLLCINFGNLTFQGPPSIFYIPDFITEEDEKVLLDKIYKAPIPKWTGKYLHWVLETVEVIVYVRL